MVWLMCKGIRISATRLETMRTVELIAKKRDGRSLTTEELDWLIQGFTNGDVADYQMSAWAMAVMLRGMDERETTDLTLAMARSGDMLDLKGLAPITVDKHSTGGVGDKTTLVLAPMVASVGLAMAKMSGRGLGFSGGTIDKLESIPGFRTSLAPAEFEQAIREIGLVVASQTGDLAPADKKLYALRDVTATVNSIPLIAASIMSKKLAAGADCIVLDVKYGSGAFMETHADARHLAHTMVAIGERAGRRVRAVISSMQQPLGYAIGNTLEVREAVAALLGHGPSDLVELCIVLGAQLLLLAGRTTDEQVARSMMHNTLSSGAAWEKFQALVRNQGGDPSAIANPHQLPDAPVLRDVTAQHDGWVATIDGQALGQAVNALGGGRQRKDDQIDPRVGLTLHTKIGDPVRAGTPLLTIHAADAAAAERIAASLERAYSLSDTTVSAPPLIEEVITF
jgi:pyrimidine-nucleoside phosphorylase